MLIRHSVVYVGAKILAGLLGMLTTAVLTHVLDPQVYGLYALTLVVMTFASNLAFDWLGLAFLRVYQSRQDGPLVISTFVQIFFGIGGLTAAILLLCWAFGLLSGVHGPAYVMGLVMCWSSAWFELVSRFEIANFRPKRYFVMNGVRAACVFVGAAGLAWLTGNPIAAAAGTAVGTLGGALLGGYRGWRFGRLAFDPALARSVLAFGLPLAVSMALASAMDAGTRWLVHMLGTLEALGLYTATLMLVQNTIVLSAGGISSAGYSLAVQAVESGDTEQARRQLLANGSLLLAVLAPAAVGMSLTAHGIAVTLVGPQFVEAVAQLTPWVAAGAFFWAFRAHYLEHAFHLGKRPNLQVRVTGLGAVIALGLCFPLVPRFGALGAAIAVTIAMAVSSVHAVIEGRRAYPVPLPLNAASRILVACLVMAGCVKLVPLGGTPGFIVQVVVGAVSYSAAAVALNLLGARDHLLWTVSFRRHRRMRHAIHARPQ